MSDQEDAIPGDRAEPASAMSQETENTAGDTAGTTSPVPLVCGNCRAPLTDAFCASCGQAATRSRQLDVRQLFGDFVEKVLNLESSLLRTVVGLTLRPGFVCREYVSGKRTLYTNPVTYLMLYAFLYAFAANVIAGFIGLETELDDRLVEEWGGP